MLARLKTLPNAKNANALNAAQRTLIKGCLKNSFELPKILFYYQKNQEIVGVI
jgi:hypothetical protein